MNEKEERHKMLTKKLKFLRSQISHNKESTNYEIQTFRQLLENPQSEKRKDNMSGMIKKSDLLPSKETKSEEKHYRLPLLVLKLDSSPEFLAEQNAFKVRIQKRYHDIELNPIN